MRVMVIGASGSGKSTLAVRLGEIWALPVTHLDPLFWTADWTPAPRAAAVAAVDAVVHTDDWLIDGDFVEAGDRRASRVDVVVWLDLPVAICLRRAVGRWLSSRGASRPDLPIGGRETFDPTNLRQIVGYPRHGRVDTAAWLAALPDRVRIHRLRTPEQVRAFVAAAPGAR